MPTFEPPYRCLSNLRGEPWSVALDREEMVVAPEIVEGWDPSRRIRVRRLVTVDPEAVGEETGLGPGSRLRLVAGWVCDATRTRVFEAQHEFSPEDRRHEVELRFEVDGSKVASAIALQTQIILLDPGTHSLRTAARLPGSVLYDEKFTVHIEGTASRFPMEWIAFEDAAYPAGAAWYLDWEPAEPETSVLGGLRLYLNSSHPRLSSLLETDDDRRAALLETMELDIIRQIVSGAFSSYEFMEHQGAFEEGTIGHLATLLIRLLFPDYSANDLKLLRHRELARFEAIVQSATRFLARSPK